MSTDAQARGAASAPRLAVIGLGLIGGSLARALRSAQAVSDIRGYDPDASQRRLAVELGVVDAAPDSAAEAVAGADVVVLAVPVLRTREALAAVLGALAPGAVVTDVGSTKLSVLDDVRAACGGTLPGWFVAAHPIAGTERSGVAAGSAALFHGKRVVVTPHASQDAAALAQVEALWQAVGARVVRMEAHEHDAIFAATSHLPHLLAFAFVEMLSSLPEADAIFPNAGGGFRDFTRIASSSPTMWHDIVQANAACVATLLDRQIGALQTLADAIAREDWPALQACFERARATRERHLALIE